MSPTLFGTLHSHSVCLVLAVLAGVFVIVASGIRHNIAPERLLVGVLILVLATLGGAKVYSLMERGGSPYPLLLELSAGYRYPGGMLGLGVGLTAAKRYWMPELTVLELGDVVAPGVGFGIAVARIGCFLNGCCFGIVTAVPWAVVFPEKSQAWRSHLGRGLISSVDATSLPVHPLQLYMGLLAVLAGCVAWWLQRRKRFSGEVILVVLAVQPIGKFLLEFFRDPRIPHVQMVILTVGMVSTATWALLRIRVRSTSARLHSG